MPAAKKSTGKSGAPKSSSASKSTRAESAITLLTRDHREVRQLFKDYEKLIKAQAEGEERQQLAQQICMMLEAHALIEEEIFYPAARGAVKEQDLLDEAEVEHASVKALIGQIQGMSPDDDLYDAKVTVLAEYVEHHVKEEETEMFPLVKKTDLDLTALGQELAERKDELMQGSDSGVEAEATA